MNRGARVRLAAAVCLGVTLGLAGVGHAMMVEIPLARLVSEAESIVRGTVVSRASHWNETGTRIVTDVTIAVSETIEGRSSSQALVRVTGGTVGEIGLVSSVDPTFDDGEEVIVFLDTTREPASVVGLHQGKFRVADGAVDRQGAKQPVDDFIEEIREHSEDPS